MGEMQSCELVLKYNTTSVKPKLIDFAVRRVITKTAIKLCVEAASNKYYSQNVQKARYFLSEVDSMISVVTM